MEDFTLVERTASSGPHHLFDDVVKCWSAKTADHDYVYIAALRENNPKMIITAVPERNVSLRAFAAAGYATCELDTKTDSYHSWKGYAQPAARSDEGGLGEVIFYAKYHYRWNNEDFSFCVADGVQYILKECQDGEHVLGSSKVTDKLIVTIGDWVKSMVAQVVWVYDNYYWRPDAELYKQVMKSSWDNVILDEGMKKELTTVTNKFFSSKSVYEDLGVPWKRGLMFYGPPGNGKTTSIRALMHELYTRDDPIPTLYVKDAPYTWCIGEIFDKARQLAPCMLILEDVETIVTPETRSYFFNEMDGLANNDGLFVVASTNFLDKLDPGLSKRPSRFDRKYNFPIPDFHERVLYCEYWHRKLKSNKDIEFPKGLCPEMARVTDSFSFAFMQECFVATLVALANDEVDDDSTYGGADSNRTKVRQFDSEKGPEDFKIWRVFKKQADILRKEVEGQKSRSSQLSQWLKADDKASEDTIPHSAAGKRGHCHSCCKCQASRPGQNGEQVARAGRRERSEILPELPRSDQKHMYFTDTAFEWRL